MIQTQYDIYYQKFDQQGNKVGEALIFTDLQNTRTLSNLTTNEFTLNNSIPGGSLLVTHLQLVQGMF